FGETWTVTVAPVEQRLADRVVDVSHAANAAARELRVHHHFHNLRSGHPTHLQLAELVIDAALPADADVFCHDADVLPYGARRVPEEPVWNSSSAQRGQLGDVWTVVGQEGQRVQPVVDAAFPRVIDPLVKVGLDLVLCRQVQVREVESCACDAVVLQIPLL